MADIRHGQEGDIGELMFALASAQGEFPEIPKNREGKIKGFYKKGPMAGKPYQYEFKYADIADILKVIRPILSKHKLAFLQLPYEEDGTLRLKTSIYYGHSCIWSDSLVCNLAIDFKEIGGAVTYARRVYGAPMLGVSAQDDTVDSSGEHAEFFGGDDNGPGSLFKPNGDPINPTQNNKFLNSQSNKFLNENCFFDTDQSADEREKMIIDMSTCDTITELREWAAKAKPIKDQLQPKDSEIVVTEFKKFEVKLAAKRINEMASKQS